MAERGRPRSFDRERALASAMLLFWRRGYSATSVAELCQAMGIGSPSLYAAFGSKEALYAEALKLYGERFGPRIWTGFDAAPTAREAIRSLLLDSAGTLAEDSCGCMVTLANIGEPGACQAQALLAEMRAAILEKVTGRLAAAQRSGELPGTVDVAALGRFYLGVQQGMSVQARDGAAQPALAAMAEVAMAAWPAA
ncbi:TetR family transcriptional regulator [Pseudoroseomonas deserti]|uniref:TetR family transcriptional regulator n=1 Tax=Teichococcus deserti TaxID=1817963 RepID=A0A1V2H7S3_9PROT|nr:TetR/AcrR family transcriptional regulator [Pseudoroseomonas deserti]ONG56361.1 TetR family transcriptional regulator [Pseudoroseomonas deserti]